jgi:hypothetical protein
MITSQEYLARIAKMRPNIYVDGEVIGRIIHLFCMPVKSSSQPLIWPRILSTANG